MMARMLRWDRRRRISVGSSAHIVLVMALRAWGRLKMMRA
jgi:hypothetical protein